jgi:hypothetical protein
MHHIVVAGDLILDYHLVQHPVTPSYHREHLRHTVLYRQPGGAWYLKEVLDLACSDLDVSIHCPPIVTDLDTVPRVHINQSYSVWSLYKRDQGSKEQVWRISKFLGYQAPGKRLRLLKMEDDPPDPDVLVLDDLGLGFRERQSMWPRALGRNGRPNSIVLKTVAPLGEGLLWEHLRAHFLDRLTVVMRVKDLRLRRASISSSLSWDSTIEEIVDEFQNGLSAQDLARCRRVVVHFEDAAAAVFTQHLPNPPKAQGDPRGGGSVGSSLIEDAGLERFIYHPEEMEGSWLSKRPGITYGTSSIIAAQMVRHELEPGSYSLCTALMRALAAMKVNHECGGGEAQAFRAQIPADELKRVFHWDGRGKSSKRALSDTYEAYSAAYCTAFRHEIFSDTNLRTQPPYESNLLRDVTGAGFEYVEAKATEVVTRGWEQALKFAPKARYGKYLTVDRDEIERINAIRSMILSYRSNLDDRQPLSIAVFGPPGSGKSFAIKQLAAELFGEDQSVIEFNLSQFGESGQDLHTAFHRVRDASVQGRIPLVFWDEFDSQGMKWLKEFLMPLQDAKFQSGSLVYPFGKSIFIFAGGVHFNFEEFNKSEASGGDAEEFRRVKGPDFVSRLRGYVDIKGPNPKRPRAAAEQSHTVVQVIGSAAGPRPDQDARLQDVEHIIRRAILLRSALERYHSNLIDQKTKLALISPSVIRGFLRVERFLHGARSLEAVVNMSTLAGTNYFGVAELPSPDLLRLHATKDFLTEVHEGQVLAPALEALAAEYYEQSRKAAHVPRAAGAPGTAPPLRFSELDEVDKEEWRVLARLLPAKLLDLGYRISPRGAVPPESRRKVKFSREELRNLRRIEHDIWLRTHLLKGYDWGAKNNNDQLLHQNITGFGQLTGRDRSLDETVAESLSNVLWKNSYVLVKL